MATTKEPGLHGLLRYGDWMLGIGVVGLLLVLVTPLPSFLIDVLIGLNITASILVLLIVTNSANPLELSTFPSILLFTTLMRLAVNVATTRAILLRGEAGNVIQAFGDYVLGGNIVVGVVVFLIIVTINFIVITKGQNRISEVAARFTLDALPGKQMAIDADLQAGILSSDEAKARRQDLTREAEFFGAMDGAGKFVRGDAIAGIVIIFVNILGGVIIGWALGDMTIWDALNRYSILTVGDGLVSQIPTLLISVAAGILVTKTRSKKNLAGEIGMQILDRPRALAIGSCLLLMIGLLPGLPLPPFALLAAAFFFIYMRAKDAKEQKEAAEEEEKRVSQEKTKSTSGDTKAVDDLLTVDRLSLEIGYRLIPLVDPESGTGLLGHIAVMRRQFAINEGVLVPPIRIKDNIRLEPNTYRILLGGQEIAKGQLIPGHFLAMDGGGAERPIEGIDTVDPSFGLPAKWISADKKDQAELLGYTAVDAVSVVVTHLGEILRSHAAEVLSRDDVKHLVENVKTKFPAVVEELVPGLMTMGDIQKVLRNLLKERVPIRNLPAILETIADNAATTKDPDTLTELVRQRLARSLCEAYADDKGKLYAVTLDPELESKLEEATMARAGGAPGLEGISPAFLRKVVDETGEAVQKAANRGREPVVLAKAHARRFVRDLIAPSIPRTPVLSYSEISSAKAVESLGVVKVSD